MLCDRLSLESLLRKIRTFLSIQVWSGRADTTHMDPTLLYWNPAQSQHHTTGMSLSLHQNTVQQDMVHTRILHCWAPAQHHTWYMRYHRRKFFQPDNLHKSKQERLVIGRYCSVHKCQRCQRSHCRTARTICRNRWAGSPHYIQRIPGRLS